MAKRKTENTRSLGVTCNRKYTGFRQYIAHSKPPRHGIASQQSIVENRILKIVLTRPTNEEAKMTASRNRFTRILEYND
jgi:hypothetical protein